MKEATGEASMTVIVVIIIAIIAAAAVIIIPSVNNRISEKASTVGSEAENIDPITGAKTAGH